MKKILKYLGIISVSLVALAFAALVIVINWINPNHFKPFIVNAVYQATGRQLTLAGDIKWKLYPNLGVTLNQVTLANPDGFSGSDLAKLEHADVSVALLPLFKHRLIVKTLAVDGLALSLIQQNGRNNWTFTSLESSSTAAPDITAAKPALELEMSALSITNSSVSFDDYTARHHYALKPLNLNVTSDFGGELRFEQAKDELALHKLHLQLNDQFSADLDLQLTQLNQAPTIQGQVEVSNLRLTALLRQLQLLPNLAQLPLFDQIKFKGGVSGSLDSLKLDQFAFNLSEQMKGQTTLQISNLGQAQANPHYRGNLQLQPFNLNQVLDSLKIAVAARKGKPLLNNLAISSQGFAGDLHQIQINGLNVRFAQLVSASLPRLEIHNFAAPTLVGAISVPSFNLNQVLDGLGVAQRQRQDKPLLNQFALTTNFSLTPTSLNLTSTSFQVGNLVSGTSSLQLNNFAAPQARGHLHLNSFNLNQALDKLAIAVTSRKNKPLLNQLALTTDFNLTPTTLGLSATSFQLGNLITGSTLLQLTNFAKPQISGKINLKEFSLNQACKQLGIALPKVANPQLLEQFGLSTNFAATANSVNLTNLQTQVGASKINGNINVSSISPLAVSENLSLDKFDLSDVSNLNGYHAQLQQLHVVGAAKLNPALDLASLSGKQTLQIGNITLRGISLDRFVLQLNNAINSAGQPTGDVMKIVLNSAQVVQAVNKMRAEAEQAVKPGARDLAQITNLGSLNASLQINAGVINPSAYKLVGPSISSSGSGSLNLVSKNINYQTTNQLLTNGINIVFKKVTFPATISGSYLNPSANLDWVTIQQQLLRYAIEQNKQQIHDAVKQQVNQAVGNQVKQAIGNQAGSQAIDQVSKGVTNALGKLFGGSN